MVQKYIGNSKAKITILPIAFVACDSNKQEEIRRRQISVQLSSLQVREENRQILDIQGELEFRVRTSIKVETERCSSAVRKRLMKLNIYIFEFFLFKLSQVIIFSDSLAETPLISIPPSLNIAFLTEACMMLSSFNSFHYSS